MRLPLVTMLCLTHVLAAPVSAQLRGFADDRELAGPSFLLFEERSVPLALHADTIRTVADPPQPGVLRIDVLRGQDGAFKPIEGLRLEFVDDKGSGADPRHCDSTTRQITVRASLRTDHSSVTDGTETYRIEDRIPCEGHVQLLFMSDSAGGQALGIWQIARRAELKLKDSIGLAFWKTPVTFVWPDSGDYYSWGTVHLTRGDHWDVVGHELGHAIYDMGAIGSWGTGPHRIDGCYTAGMAMSEGWASYFSGWLSVRADDPDAKFEFMVPRRAPIRFENIPSDVCAGETNEWRVTGFFWDLYDQNSDGERSAESFARIWNALSGSEAPSASAVRARLLEAGFDPRILEALWALDFLK